MKIAQINRAADLLAHRADLVRHMAQARGGLGPLGPFADEQTIEALSGQYAEQMRRRLTEVEQELVGMGVDLNEPSNRGS